MVGGDEHAGQSSLLRPPDLGDGVADVGEEHLGQAAAASGRHVTEVAQPAVVRLDTRPAAAVLVLGVRTASRYGARGVERRDGVREDHFRGDALAVLVLEPRVAFPVDGRQERRGADPQVGIVGLQLGVEIVPHVVKGGCPRVELVVELMRQVRPVALNTGARVRVRRDQRVPTAVTHWCPFRCKRWSQRYLPREPERKGCRRRRRSAPSMLATRRVLSLSAGGPGTWSHPVRWHGVLKRVTIQRLEKFRAGRGFGIAPMSRRWSGGRREPGFHVRERAATALQDLRRRQPHVREPRRPRPSSSPATTTESSSTSRSMVGRNSPSATWSATTSRTRPLHG